MHKPIQFKNLSFSFSHKICFTDFNAQIFYGSRIAIIGRNGSGKSTLLRILLGQVEASGGEVITHHSRIGYVPQSIEADLALSGGQRFNKALTKTLASDPDVLLLDEPTNHLDVHNRHSLMRKLSSFQGTLIIVSHDMEILRHTVNTIWHVDNGYIHVFSGNYDDYIREKNIRRTALVEELSRLSRQKKETHLALMKEQERAKHSRERGEKHIKQRKWPTIVSLAKARNAQETSGKKKNRIKHKKQEICQRLSEVQLPEEIRPTFNLKADEGHGMLLNIRAGSIGYGEEKQVLSNIHLSIYVKERIAIMGDNGSGKSTFVKAILADKFILKKGDWYLLNSDDIGYLDQHYATLGTDKTVLELISDSALHWSYLDIRKHLNDFLFRKNEEVDAAIATLSGGEKARLSLALIAINPPKLLILDEMTNNLDLEAREHVIQVLKAYPGALLAISHDESFLAAIGIHTRYNIQNGQLI